MEKQNAGYANTDKQFEKVIFILEAAETAYNPIPAHLSVANLWDFQKTIEPTITAYDVAKRLKTEAIANRNKAFEDLDGTVKRAMAIAEMAEIEPHIFAEVVKYKNLIDGTNVAIVAAKFKAEIKKAKKAIMQGEKMDVPTKGRSVSQQTISKRLSNFKLLLNSLKASGKYVTNEEDMSIDALQKRYDAMNGANDAVIAADKIYQSKLVERNVLLAGEKNSVLSLIADIKTYLLGKKGGKTSKIYKDITAIKFARVNVE